MSLSIDSARQQARRAGLTIIGPEALRVAQLAPVLTALGLTAYDQGNLSGPANPWLPAVGGDHCLAIGSISAVARHCRNTGKRLRVLWLDARIGNPTA